MMQQHTCEKCGQTKGVNSFRHIYNYTKGIDTYDKTCRSCKIKKRKQEIELKLKEDLTFTEQDPMVKKIALTIVENPAMTKEEIARLLNIETIVVTQYLRTNSYLKAMKELAVFEVSGMLPKAIGGLRESLNSNNSEIKYRASKDLLQSENIMGATKVDLTVNDLRSRPAAELQKIVSDAKDLPSEVIQAEVLS